MSFQQGLSGLFASSKGLDVVGNNISNSATVGFKASDARFADAFAASMAGGIGGQIGIGTNLSTVSQQFTQGNVTTTNNPLDLAVNGSGFFRFAQSSGTVSYSRNGQVHLDKSGYLIDDQNNRLTGRVPDASGVIRAGSQPAPLQITAAQLKLDPQPTGAAGVGDYDGVKMSTNLDSRANVPALAWAAPVAPPGVATVNTATYNYSTALSVYDSLGNPHTVTFYFVKTATAGQWQVYSNTDGTVMDSATDAPSLAAPVTVTFDTAGQLKTVVDAGGTTVFDSAVVPTGTGDIPVSIDLDQVSTNLGRPTGWGATTPLTFNLNLEGTTQFGSSFATNRLYQNGYPSGELAGLGVSADGVIQGRYTNGQTQNVGQIVLAMFQNTNGLTAIGGNQWVETSVSGQPTVDVPQAGQMGALQSSAVEESNVDLTAELVKMITLQRNYQANAQTIKTQDQIMQTLVNLR